MSNSPTTSSTVSGVAQAQVRYHSVRTVSASSTLIALQPDEAFVVSSFELAEELIAGGADSARVAISSAGPSGRKHPGYAQVAPGKPLVPLTPFCFDRSILIVLPTYNERQNLEAMVEAIGKYLIADILIVDDHSPDGTGRIAERLSRLHEHVHVLHRTKKEGLGPAYVAGFQWALARDYQLIIEMDCDFSHSPWDLPRLVHRSETADLVIGSRYVLGGGTQNWNVGRRIVSRFGNRYVSLFLGREIRDWTGGFRCYRQKLLARMDIDGVKAKGYLFQVETAWRAHQLGAVICELPIRFTDRLYGRSKLGWPSVLEAITEVPRMRFQTIPASNVGRQSSLSPSE